MAAEKQTKIVAPSSVKETPVVEKPAPKTPVAEKVAPEKKAAPKKTVAKKPAAAKAAPKKTAAKKPATEKAAPKKAAAKKPAAKKAVAKKAAPKKTAEAIVIQAAGNEWDVAAVKEKAIADYVAAGHRQSGISTLTVYIKPEDRKAYYVINDKTSGSVDL